VNRGQSKEQAEQERVEQSVKHQNQYWPERFAFMPFSSDATQVTTISVQHAPSRMQGRWSPHLFRGYADLLLMVRIGEVVVA
jgi:hypothetical protein